MPLPAGVQTVTVTGLYRHPDGSAFKGRVLFAPEPRTITSALHDVIVLGDVEASPDPTTGVITAVLLATDAANCTPTGWTYRVYEQWWHVPVRDYPLSLPAATPTVNLADVAPTNPAAGEYVVVTGPQGLQGPKGDKGDPGSGGGDVASVNGQTGVVDLDAAAVGADPAGAATAAQAAAIAAAATDATTKAGAAQAAAIGAAATDATTKAAAALTSAEAYTDAHAGGAPPTRKIRITDDNLSGLPSAAAWTVVLTSAGTPLQCSIPAVAGDRIEYYPNFMYVGTHFLDWVLLDSAGAISLYATTGTSSPGAEGNPALYPSLSFSKQTSADAFTVGAGHIDGSGNVTIALAHQGTGSGTVYAHGTYPYKKRVKNIGPEPA